MILPSIAGTSPRCPRTRLRCRFVGPALLLILTATAAPMRAQEGDTRPTPEVAAPELKIDAEIARATAALEELRRFAESQLTGSATEQGELRGAVDRAAALKLRLPEIRAGSDAADRFFDTVVTQLVDARTRLREALDRIGSAPTVPRFVVEVQLDAFGNLSDRLTRLDVLTGELERTADQLEERERENRLQDVRAWWDVVRLLNDVRIHTLDRLSAGRRARILGVSREGIGQLRRELDHLALTSRVYALTRARAMRTLGERATDPFTLGAVAWVAMKLLLSVAAFVILRGRGPRIHDGTRRVLHSLSPRVGWRRRSESLLGAARAVGPWLLTLALLEVLRWALGPAAQGPELRLAYRLALIWILYRLAVDAVVGLIVASVRRYRFEFGAVRTAKLLRSVRTVLRVVFVVAVLLALSEPFLGRGYLYHVVFRLSLIALVLASLVVFRRWKNDIAQAYLEMGPPGRLRLRVEQTRTRWYGGFVALAALAVLAGQAAIHLAREFVLGFDQTRRALAFVFRRRVEKQAARTGYAGPDDEDRLPEALLRVLSDAPVSDESLVVDHFPGLDLLHESLRVWREGGAGGSFLLTGDLGIGRTSWLNKVDAGDLPRQMVTFDRRIDTDGLLAEVLGQGLDMGQPANTDRLRDALLEGPPRLVIIDRGQNLFLGRVGGYEGFESFMTLVDSTAERVFWLVSFSDLAWQHIAAVHPQLAGFRQELLLEPWPEEQIRDLIRRRTAAGRVKVSYEDLSLDAIEGVPYHVRADETEEAYTRLLWDTSLGLPRVALQYWKRSLVPDSDASVRVRLFRPPAVDELERFGDIALFLLAAVVTHESLTTNEMALVTRYSVRMCGVQVARLEALGVIRRRGDRYWVTSFWQPAVYRLLKRRNMLSD